MKIAFLALIGVACLTTPVMSQSVDKPEKAAATATAPSGPFSVTRIFKQPVYNSQDERVGDVDDILMSEDGRAVAFIVGVGGFLGIGETHVAVPYQTVSMTIQGDKPRMVMDITREQLKEVSTLRYDRDRMVWVGNDPKPKP